MHPQHPNLFSQSGARAFFKKKTILWHFQTQQTQSLVHFQGKPHGTKKYGGGKLRLTSHDTTINNFAISIEEFGHIIGPCIRGELCKSS
jgi:hypothetical protein